nr:MAG TPA: hypothetical protein [Caudoviricetes sp.]
MQLIVYYYGGMLSPMRFFTICAVLSFFVSCTFLLNFNRLRG